VIDRDSWSAVTISQSDVRLVILNSGHSQTRQANSLVHELAHIILNHASDEAQVSREGFLFRARFDKEQEDEADWLSACLLLPREGLLRAYRRTPNPAALARRFGVSEALVNWRLRMTGIPRQAKRPGPSRRSPWPTSPR
jgi:Zn-dependent peptidase ImmA (M78 family)